MQRWICTMCVLALVIFSCAQKQEEQQPAVADSTAFETQKTDSAMSGMPAGQDLPVPAWYKTPPQKDGLLYAVASGRSLRANLARSKAVMRAQQQLAAKLAEPATSPLNKNAAGGAQAAGPENNGVQLGRAVIVKQKQFKKGKYWYVYVLMEMPKVEN